MAGDDALISGRGANFDRGWKKIVYSIYFFIALQLLFIFLSLGSVLKVTDVSFFRFSGEDGPSPVRWILAGGVTPTSATFRLRLSPSSSPASEFFIVHAERLANSTANLTYVLPLPRYDALEGAPDFGTLSVSVPAGTLAPRERYFYGIHPRDASANHLAYNVGTFETPGREGERWNFTMATSGCAATGSNHPVFHGVARSEALFFLLLGDMHYEDLSTPSVERRLEAFDDVMSSPNQQEMFAMKPLVYSWDDHDWLGNNMGADYENPTHREAALASYRIAIPHYEMPARAQIQAEAEAEAEVSIYHAFTIGTVRFIVTDLRSQAQGDVMFGDDQRSWLYDELSNSSAYDYVVLASSRPWIGEEEEGPADEWWGFPAERRALSDHIANVVTAKNLIVISGDSHMSGFDDGSNTYFGSDASNSPVDGNFFPNLVSGPLDKLGSVKGGPFSHGCAAVRAERSSRFSTISFDFPPRPESDPCISIRIYETYNRPIFRWKRCGRDIFGPDAADPIARGFPLHQGARCALRLFTPSTGAQIALALLFALLQGAGMLYFLRRKTRGPPASAAGSMLLPLLGPLLTLGTVGTGTAPYVVRGIKALHMEIGSQFGLAQSLYNVIFAGTWAHCSRQQLDREREQGTRNDALRVEEPAERPQLERIQENASVSAGSISDKTPLSSPEPATANS